MACATHARTHHDETTNGRLTGSPAARHYTFIVPYMDRDTQHARAAIIRKLNDEFRRSGGNGRVMVTRGVLGVGYDFAAQALERVSAFDDFGNVNDPWEEHDYGAFTLRGHEVC